MGFVEFLFLDEAWDEVTDVIFDALRSLFYMITTSIYQLIKWLYDIFLKLCNSRILDDDVLKIITDKVGIILGIVMLFVVTFSVIQMVLEPDKLTDKEKGIANIVKKIILVVVMLGISQFVFRLLYVLQVEVVESDIISKFLIPYDIDKETKEDFGGIISADLFLSFYKIDERLKDDNGEIKDNKAKNAYNNMLKFRDNIIENNNYDLGSYYLNKEPDDGGDGDVKIEYIMEFNYIISTAVGAAVLYFIFNYCISVGVRTFQLAFLEIISPMAIVSYLSPKKDTMFEKWWKMYLATYIDVFLRVIIINLVVFLILVLLGADSSQVFWDSVGGKTGDLLTDLFIEVIIIIALLMFAKKAPDLLKDFFPSGASKLGFGISSPKQMFDNMLGGNLVKGGLTGAAGLAIGAFTGAIGNAIRGGINDKGNRLRGVLGGLAGGALAGAKAGAGAKGVFKSYGASRKAAKDQSHRIAEWRANGGVSSWERWKTGMQQSFGVQTNAEIYDKNKENLEKENSSYNQLAGYFDASKKRAESKILEGNYKGNKRGELAANNARSAKNKIDILKAQAGNLDRNSKTYARDLAKIEAEITQQEIQYSKAMDIAIEQYINSSGDDVITQNMAMAQSVIDANDNYSGFFGQSVTDFKSFESANNKAKKTISDNTVKLSENASKGKSARADAKYSGKGGGKS